MLTVSAKGPTGEPEPLLVNYTISGTASNGQGYQTIPTTVVIPAGSATATILIEPLDAGGGSGTVVLTLASGSGYTVSQTAASDTVTINETGSGSDGPGAYQVQSVAFFGDGGQTSSLSVTNSDWIWANSLADAVKQAIGGSVDLNPGTYTDTYTFPDSSEFLFQTPVYDSGTSSFTLTIKLSTDDPGWLPGQDTDSGSYVTVTVTKSPAPMLAVANAVAVEGDQETFTVTLSQAVDYAVSVPYHTVDGSAMAGTDYTATSDTLTFSSNQTRQTVTVQTQLDGNAASDLNFSLVLGTPSVSGVTVSGSGTATIQPVTGEITIYNPNGTPSNDGTVNVGDWVPMTVRLTSPAAVDGTFTLSYDASCFKITTDAAGNNVVYSDDTQLTPSTGGTQLYLWGLGPTASTEQIALNYGDPVPIAKTTATAVAPTGGLDVTQALKNGLMRLEDRFCHLTYAQQGDLAEQLITASYAYNAWDIETIKYWASQHDGNLGTQTICTPGEGVNGTKPNGQPKTLVTVVDGAGTPEVYQTDAVNYLLYGAAMRMIYDHYDGISEAALRQPGPFYDNMKNGDGLDAAWLQSIDLFRPWPLDFGWIDTRILVTGNRWRVKWSRYNDGAGVDVPVAFAEAGWTGNWSYINGLGIKAAIPCKTEYAGMLEWRLGNRDFLKATKLRFQQSGSSYDSWNPISPP